MRKILTLAFAIVIAGFSNAQTEPKVFLNHLYFVLDSATFNHLFDSAYLLNLGDTSNKTTTTTSDSWTGKYLFGKQSYFEFFSSSNFQQAPEQGCGFGFMTMKSGDFSIIKNNWETNYKDSLQTDTSVVTNRGPAHKWFYATGLPFDSTVFVATWLMENTPDEYKSVGFTDNEIKAPITWQQYYEKRYHKKILKPFNKIVAVEIETNAKEYEYLKKSFLGFGLKENSNSFYNDEVIINYSISDIPLTKLKSATIELDEMLPQHQLIISNHSSLYVDKKTAVFKFNY